MIQPDSVNAYMDLNLDLDWIQHRSTYAPPPTLTSTLRGKVQTLKYICMTRNAFLLFQWATRVTLADD